MESYNTVYWTNLSFVHVGLLLHFIDIQKQGVEMPPECTLSLTKYPLPQPRSTFHTNTVTLTI